MPLILATNDDGLHAFGLKVLVDSLARVGDVVVIAPSGQRSAVSHAITIDRPLRVRPRSENSFEVDGTPADTVFVALHQLLPRPPDLVVSGVNHGLNLGMDIFYSGTVAAAMEAAIKGIPALAVSQQLMPNSEGPETSAEQAQLFLNAARFAASLATALLADPLPGGVALNANCPACITSEYCWTRAGDRVYGAEIVSRVDPRGRPYYWIGGPSADPDGPPGSDARAIRDGAISVTPLKPDFNASWPQHRSHPELLGFSTRNASDARADERA